MKNFIRYILPLLSVVFLAGCNQDSANSSNGQDAIVKFAVSGSDKVINVGSHADGDEFIFKIEVLDTDGNVVASYDDHTSITDGISLKGGNYTFRASTGTDVEAGFDSSYYAGTTTMAIEGGKTYNVEITCYLANVMVSVSTTNLIKESFPSFKVTVSNTEADAQGNFDASESLEFDYDTETSDSRGYFRVTGILPYKVELTNTAGVSNTVFGKITSVGPQRHYKLKFTINDDGNGNGGLSIIDIVVDDDMDEIEYEFNIDPDADGVPSIGGGDNDIDLNEPIQLEEGDQIGFTLDISSTNALYSLTVEHASDHIATLGIPKSFDILQLDESQVAAINAAGLTWTVSSVKTRSLYEEVYSVSLIFDELLSALPADEYDFTVTVEDQMAKTVSQPLKFIIAAGEPEPEPESALEITSSDIDAWARFANISGRWTSEQMPEGISLQYRAEADESWTEIATDKLAFSGNGFQAKATYLDPATTYYVKAVQGDGAETEPVAFTTERALQMPNMGFDEWCYGTGGNQAKRTMYPNADLIANYWWDTSNYGANTLSAKNPTSEETNFVVSGSAAKLASDYINAIIFQAFAAASIYTGEFGSVSGVGASLNFGREFTVRPSKLKGYYSYNPGTINYAKDPYSDLKGETDFCHIWVMLTDWDSPFTVNTNTGTFIDVENDPGIIAYAEIITDEANPDAYKQFELELVYRNDRKPTHGIIVCSASRYGDFFTGSTSSVLYIDEFEFVFDPE